MQPNLFSGMELRPSRRLFISSGALIALCPSFRPKVVSRPIPLSLSRSFALSLSVGAVCCAAEAVLSKFAEVYFKHELADGNPFTLRGAKELLRLGILTIAIPLGTVIVCSIGVAIAEVIHPGVDELSIGEFTSAGVGVMMIVLSLFCRYGAERSNGKAEENSGSEAGIGRSRP